MRSKRGPGDGRKATGVYDLALVAASASSTLAARRSVRSRPLAAMSCTLVGIPAGTVQP